MRNTIFYLLILLLFAVVACTKDKTPMPPDPPEPEVWEKFVGNYHVYDTNGNYLYQMEIQHYYEGLNIYGNHADSLRLLNFADTIDLNFEFQINQNKNFISIGFHDSVVGHDGHTWQFYTSLDDPNTEIIENQLFNDSIILSFKQTNIQYWINEGVAYFYCECKQIAVKQ